MPRQFSRRDENGVESYLMVCIGWICGEKMVGRARDPHLLAFVDGVGRGGKVGARLDLDRDQQPRAACDDIDLPDRTAIAARQQPESLEAQKKRGLALGAMAALFGGLSARRWGQLSGSSLVISSARR